MRPCFRPGRLLLEMLLSVSIMAAVVPFALAAVRASSVVLPPPPEAAALEYLAGLFSSLPAEEVSASGGEVTWDGGSLCLDGSDLVVECPEGRKLLLSEVGSFSASKSGAVLSVSVARRGAEVRCDFLLLR